MKLGMQVGLGAGNTVLDGDPASPPQKGHSPPAPPNFFQSICCRKMAGWIKMPLGMEVGLGLDDFVLDGDPAPSLLPPKKRGAQPPIFGTSIVTKRLDASRCHLVWK